MTTTAAAHDLQHAPSPTGGVRRLLLGPGLLRGAWMFVLFGWIGFGIVVLIRWGAGWHPILLLEPIVLIAGLVSGPIGFLSGIGAFDLGSQFGNVQRCQHLARLDLVTHIDRDAPEVAAHLGIERDRRIGSGFADELDICVRDRKTHV